MATKNAKINQQYDEYWKLTVEYSDIFGVKFNKTLKIIVKFIDDNISKINSINLNEYLKGNKTEIEKLSLLYKELQNTIFNVYKKVDKGSTRKSINQFIKLGFINPYLKGYNKLTKSFLKVPANRKEEKKSIFSKIF